MAIYDALKCTQMHSNVTNTWVHTVQKKPFDWFVQNQPTLSWKTTQPDSWGHVSYYLSRSVNILKTSFGPWLFYITIISMNVVLNCKLPYVFAETFSLCGSQPAHIWGLWCHCEKQWGIQPVHQLCAMAQQRSNFLHCAGKAVQVCCMAYTCHLLMLIASLLNSCARCILD